MVAVVCLGCVDDGCAKVDRTRGADRVELPVDSTRLLRPTMR